MPDMQSRSDAAAGAGVTSTESWIRRGRVTWTYVGIMILTIAGVWLFRAVLASIFTFVIGGFLAFLLRPIVALFMRWKLSRGLAVLATSLLLVLFLALALAVIVPQVATEVQQVAAAIPAQQRQLQPAVAKATSKLPTSVQASLAKSQQEAAAQAASATKDLAAALAAALGSFAGLVFDLFLGFIIAVWFMLDGAGVAKWSLSVLPPAWREDASEVGIAFDKAFGGFIRGSIIDMSLMFAGMAIGFNLLNVPYATALGALCGVLAIIPIVGGIVGGAIATLVALTVSPQLALWTLVVVLVVEQTVDSVIAPIVMGDAVRLHPLAILFSLAVGGAIAGVLGMIVAIPAAAAAYTVYLYFARKFGMLEPAPEPVLGAKPARH
jgi:predicted PurR-regulated permease PerM